MFPEYVIIAGLSDMLSEDECVKNGIYEWNEMNAPTYGFPSLSYNTLPIEFSDEIWETLFTSEPIDYAHGRQIAARVISQFGEESSKILTIE